VETDSRFVTYDELQARLDRALSEMAGLAQSQTALAVDALVKRDRDLAQRVVETDGRIDQLHETIEDLGMRMLALRSPVARDLREVLTAMKVATDLERIGDHAKTAARRALTLLDHSVSPPAHALRRMAIHAAAIVEQAVDAYFDKAILPPDLVAHWPVELGESSDALFRQMLTYMLETPRHITPAIHLVFIAYSLEGTGDHAAAIAEQTRFLVDGTITAPTAEPAQAVASQPQ
jgi:phosphate transport system protein